MSGEMKHLANFTLPRSAEYLNPCSINLLLLLLLLLLLFQPMYKESGESLRGVLNKTVTNER